MPNSTAPRPAEPLSRPLLQAYLRAQARLLRQAVEDHQRWTVVARTVFLPGDSVSVAEVARAAGGDLGAAFRIHKIAAEALTPPGIAQRCHQYWLRWLALMVLAADCLSHAPEDGRDLRYLRDCRDYLNDAREAAAGFNQLRLKLHELVRGGGTSVSTGGPP